MKIYYIILILVIIYIYLKNYNIINEPFDDNKSVVNIYDNISKEMFEKIINNKTPTIFQNINNKLYFNKSSNLKLKNKIEQIFNPYIIPYAITHKYNIHNENINSHTPIIKQTNYRYLYLLLKGYKKIILFSPKQVSNLYANNDISPINFWDNDPKKFPKFENIKYLELDLEPNEMIYIPYNWWYTMFSTSKTISLSCNSESLSSYFLKFS